MANKAGFDATQTSLIAFFEIGQLIIAVLGAMVITVRVLHRDDPHLADRDAPAGHGLRREG